MNARILGLGLALGWIVAGPVQAQAAHGAIMLDEAWIRAAPPDAPVRAGYARIMNHSAGEVVIDGARSDAFGAIEIHEMRDVDGVMRMRPVPSLVLPAHGTLRLEPGGLHLMLMRPTAPLADDARVSIILLHGQDEVVRGEFTVGEGTAAASGHDAMHHGH